MSQPRFLLDLAARVISSANREHPADAVLREFLKAERHLTAADKASVTRSVLSFYRWRGWLEASVELSQGIEFASALACRFRQSPETFSDSELRERAVPAWLSQELEMPPDWLRCLQQEPALWLRARRGHVRTLATAWQGCRIFGEGIWEDTLHYSGDLDLFRTKEFHAGLFEVQDLSSQAVGLLCQPEAGQTWWDACAGEGGKLLHLSELMHNQGLIWASDRAGWRLQKLKRRAARARVFNYRAALWDGGARRPTRTAFDGVLVDAPCSGVGTWHRNPHARWTTTPQDVKELSLLQRQLLANVAGSIKPGGKLIYAVCTLTRSETIGVVAAFQQDFPEFRPLPLVNPLPSRTPSSEKVTLWPQDFGGNGMFVAGWSRP